MNVPAARSALRIIRHLAERSGPVRAATIARELELPRSSVYHLLAVLQDEGFVVHSPEHQGYSLGPLVGEIGTTVLASDALARVGRPLLERLVAETKLPVVGHLGLLQHTDVVYAVKVAAARAPAVVTSVGVRLPAHLTATGRAMLAALPPAQFAANYSPGDLAAAHRTGAGNRRRTRGASCRNAGPRLGVRGRRHQPGLRIRRRRRARPQRLPRGRGRPHLPAKPARRRATPRPRRLARRRHAVPPHPGPRLTHLKEFRPLLPR